MKDFSVRSAVQHATTDLLPRVEREISLAAVQPVWACQWGSVFEEARGDLAAAEARGQNVDQELRLLGALIQWRLERSAERDAWAPITEADFP